MAQQGQRNDKLGAESARPDRETILDRPYFFVSAKRGQAEHSDKENIQNQAQAMG